MHDLRIIEDHDIVNWLKDARFLSEFPFLQAHANSIAGKRTCCGGIAKTLNFHSIKQSLMALPAERRSRLKQMLDAQQCRFSFIQDGKVGRYTF